MSNLRLIPKPLKLMKFILYSELRIIVEKDIKKLISFEYILFNNTFLNLSLYLLH